jgi:hypothetical protein
MQFSYVLRLQIGTLLATDRMRRAAACAGQAARDANRPEQTVCVGRICRPAKDALRKTNQGHYVYTFTRNRFIHHHHLPPSIRIVQLGPK